MLIPCMEAVTVYHSSTCRPYLRSHHILDSLLVDYGRRSMALYLGGVHSVNREIFARKFFRLLNFALFYFLRFGKCGSAAFCSTFLLFNVEKNSHF